MKNDKDKQKYRERRDLRKLDNLSVFDKEQTNITRFNQLSFIISKSQSKSSFVP